MGRKKGIPRVSFSRKRTSGLSSAKAKLSRQIGIPLTKSGRQRKMGAAMGCCVSALSLLTGFSALVVGTQKLVSFVLA